MKTFLSCNRKLNTRNEVSHKNKTEEFWRLAIYRVSIKNGGWNWQENPPGMGIRERPPLGCLDWVLPGRVQFFCTDSHICRRDFPPT